MSEEAIKTQDEVKLVLYDKDGNVKETSGSQKPTSKLEKYIKFLKRVLENW